MPIVLDGTSGITTPSLTNTGTDTLSAGTANGVTYLNGSKVLTSGTALVFDGTSLTTTNNVNVPNTFGFKNRIINGDMRIDQRNAGASVTGIVGSVYPVDRWPVYSTIAGRLTAQQSTTAPANFINSVVVTSTAATTFAATDEYEIWQKIEGFNVADFGWGTANAKSFTLSFWVRSSLTGTFGGVVTNGTYNRSYVFSYTISTANTWEQKSITIAGDTTGTWITNNGNGLYLSIDLGSGASYKTAAGVWNSGYYTSPTGSVNLLATNGATFYITGVQLEKGNIATSFDVRPYGTELALCQRYYQRVSGFVCASGTAGLTSCATSVMFKTEMRASPSVGLTAVLSVTQVNTNDYTQSSIAVSIAGGGARVSTLGVNAAFDNFPTLPTNCSLPSIINSGVLTLSAEL